MDEYLILATSLDTFKNDKNESFDCRYIVAKKTDNVKPLVYKCTENAFKEAKKLNLKKCNLSFDDRSRVISVTLLKSDKDALVQEILLKDNTPF